MPRLVNENLRNFQVPQEVLAALRFLAWAVCYFSAQGISQDPHSRSGIRATLLGVNYCLT